MKTTVITLIDWAGVARRRAAAFFAAMPRLDRRYAVAGVLSAPVLVWGPYAAPFMLALVFFGAVVWAFVMLAARAGVAVWRALVVPAAMLPFIGLAGPVEDLPNWMQLVAHLFPPTYALEGLRTLAVFGAFDAAAFVASVLLGAVYFFFIYLWTEAHGA